MQRLMSLAALLIGNIVFTRNVWCRGVEIEATSEWRLLKEGDTIPAGLHVKIDLSTGQKWVKTIDDGDSKGNIDTKAIEGSVDVEVNTDGGMTSLMVAEGGTDLPEKEGLTAPDNNLKIKEDVMMMHRTLSQLPEEDMERFGGLPELPAPSRPSGKYDEAQYAMFQSRMKEIWEARQEELRKLQEALADLPKILKDHIASIGSYIEVGYVPNKAKLQEDDWADIIFILEDLEYHLSDLDMARDFHTLGGWPLLASLLSPKIHENAMLVHEQRNSQNNETYPLHTVQSAAAWALGTAVKNTEEFHSWAVEDISPILSTSSPTTPLHVILDNMSSNPSLNKYIYALGAFLRGNSLAQKHFLSLEGPSILLQHIKQLTDQQNWKASIKIFTLIYDLITDDIHDDVVGSVTTDEWCASLSSLLLKSQEYQLSFSLQDKLLHVLQSMVLPCRQLLLSHHINDLLLNWNFDEDDGTWKEEILSLTHSALKVFNDS